MSQYSDSKLNISITKGEKPSISEENNLEKKHSSLKLVISNSTVAQKKLPSLKPTFSNTKFLVEVSNVGIHVYKMKIKDPFHDLESDLILDIEKSGREVVSVCHFPAIEHKESNTFLDEDETLYGIIMVQFQMKVLEQLFLFCIEHNALQLNINVLREGGYRGTRENLKFLETLHFQLAI